MMRRSSHPHAEETMGREGGLGALHRTRARISPVARGVRLTKPDRGPARMVTALCRPSVFAPEFLFRRLVSATGSHVLRRFTSRIMNNSRRMGHRRHLPSSPANLASIFDEIASGSRAPWWDRRRGRPPCRNPVGGRYRPGHAHPGPRSLEPSSGRAFPG